MNQAIRRLFPAAQKYTYLNSAAIAPLPTVAAYLEELTDFLCEILPTEKYEIISSRAKGEKSQIICIENRNGFSSNAVAEHLRRENIIVSPRGSRIRIAPHFFNNFGDIERLVENLP